MLGADPEILERGRTPSHVNAEGVEKTEVFFGTKVRKNENQRAK